MFGIRSKRSKILIINPYFNLLFYNWHHAFICKYSKGYYMNFSALLSPIKEQWNQNRKCLLFDWIGVALNFRTSLIPKTHPIDRLLEKNPKFAESPLLVNVTCCLYCYIFLIIVLSSRFCRDLHSQFALYYIDFHWNFIKYLTQAKIKSDEVFNIL